MPQVAPPENNDENVKLVALGRDGKRVIGFLRVSIFQTHMYIMYAYLM